MSSELGEWYYFWKTIMDSTNIFRNKQPYDIYTVLSVINISIIMSHLLKLLENTWLAWGLKTIHIKISYKVSTQEYVNQDLLTIYWYNRNSSQRPLTKPALKNPTTQPPNHPIDPSKPAAYVHDGSAPPMPEVMGISETLCRIVLSESWIQIEINN